MRKATRERIEQLEADVQRATTAVENLTLTLRQVTDLVSAVDRQLQDVDSIVRGGGAPVAKPASKKAATGKKVASTSRTKRT